MLARLFCNKCHDRFCGCTKYLNKPDWGLLLIRISLAIVFIIHGLSKLQNIDQTTAFFATFGLGVFWVYLVGLIELIGGLFILFGVMVREVSVILAINMMFAIYLVKADQGFSGGFEFEFLLFFILLGLAMMGCGKCAVQCHRCE